MSKAKRLLSAARLKHGKTIKRIATRPNCILLVIFLSLLAVIFTLREEELEEENVVSKLDEFQPANYVEETRHASATSSSTRREGEILKRNTKAVTESINSEVTGSTESPSYEVTLAKRATEFWNPMLRFKDVMPAIKVFYRGKAPLLKSKTKKAIAEQQKKITYRDAFEALAHPMLFPKTTEGYELHESPPRPGLNDWVQANSPRDKAKFLVYSAYWDDRFVDTNNVRVMAVMASFHPPTVYCRLLMSDGTHNDVPVANKIINEYWRLTYASYILSCEVSKNSSPPDKVLVSVNRNFSHSAVLPVYKNKEDAVSPRGDLAVCVKPLHYSYDRATWLAEFIEFNRLLGVEHFFFYNHSVGQKVDNLLRHYMRENVVSVLPWNLPVRSQKEIRTEGIFSSLNDCVLRTMHLFHYVMLLDFDEYIVPREHDNYLDMLAKLEEDNKRIRGKPGSFVFKNVFFYLYWENDTAAYRAEPEKPPQWMPYFVTQYKTRRLTTSMKMGARSKYIVVPERVIEAGNHVVWRHASGSRAVLVPESVALLHHYRICEFGGFSCLKKPSLVDRTANKFGEELLNRVLGKCGKVYPELEGRCPVSPPLGSPW